MKVCQITSNCTRSKRGVVRPYGSSVPGMNTAAVRKIDVRFFLFFFTKQLRGQLQSVNFGRQVTNSMLA